MYGSVLETIVVTRSEMLGPPLVRVQPGRGRRGFYKMFSRQPGVVEGGVGGVGS